MLAGFDLFAPRADDYRLPAPAGSASIFNAQNHSARRNSEMIGFMAIATALDAQFTAGGF